MIAAVGLAGAAFGLAQLATPFGLEQARLRWRAMDDSERAKIVSRYEELQSMSEADRRELFRRVERLQEVEGELIDEMPAAMRAKLERLGTREQRRLVREMLETELSLRGRRLREELPAELVARLEQVPPRERRRLLAEYEGEVRRLWLERVAGALGLGADEVAEIRELSGEEAHMRMLALRRQVIERQVELRGLPRWISLDVWREMQPADNRVFNRLWDRELGRHERKKAAGEAAADPVEQALELPRALDRVRTALRPDPSWFVELAHLSREERRAAVGQRVRERTLRALEALSLEEGQRAELERLPDGEFAEAVRALVRERWQAEGRGAFPARR